LLDSDAALVAPFVALGVRAEDVTFGALLADECARLGVTVDDYLDRYDEAAAMPFEGVDDMVAQLDRWAVCSNKHPQSGRTELERLGWKPEVALFADAFGGPKRLGPVLDCLEADPHDVLFVGDTDHDRRCAAEVGCRFALATWNPRARAAGTDIAVRTPGDVLALLG
jgi:phosphoglycolate phosphatase-like HAD superfamily hydrolase